MGSPANLLTRQEIDVLIQALARARGKRGFTAADVQVVVTWAETAASQAQLLYYVLQGTVLPYVYGEDVMFMPADAKPQPEWH
jgi:hypothetical protein